MTFSTAQKLDPERLSVHARKMLTLRDEVLLEWGRRLRSTVKEAEHLPQPILTNTFPALYDNLVVAISPEYSRCSAAENNTVASEHGGERARLTHYNAQAVILEYQLLRWTIFDVLNTNGVQLNSDELFIISTSIDDSIREAASAFALAQSALRERFVASLTHDLRNPLAAANAAAEIIKLTAESPQIRELAVRITDNTARIDAMIQELLDAVVFQSGERLRLHLEAFDIYELAKEVCEQFASIHGSRFELRGGPVNGRWDRQAFKRTIENLLGNAVKYGLADTSICVSVVAAHDRMTLSVHNKGEKIPPEQIESIFQVFRRASAAKEGDTKGWGIGLPYVRSVAESHGGSVGVDSSLDLGTTFVVDVPIDARPYQNVPVLDP